MISLKNVGSQFSRESGERSASYNPADWGVAQGPKGKVSLKNRLRGNKPAPSWDNDAPQGPRGNYDPTDW
jgi:hypothetical protein